MAPNTPRVCVVGTGISGIGMGIILKHKLGLETFELLEKDPAGVGGVWRKLKYPGLSCDIPAHFYSFSFERWPHWSRDYPSALEIHPYLVHCVEKYGIRDHISYGVEVTELRWDDDRSVWRVMTKVDGKFVEREFEVVFNSGGVFNKQYTPDYPGIPSFKGEQIQAADDRVVGNDWDRVQLAGKRVSIVGTGPTAIQIISEIAHKVEHLDIYQRTATWILPMDNKPFDEKQRKEFQDDAKLRAYRQNLMDQTERMWLLISKPYSSTAVKIQDRCLRHLRETVKDPELVKKLTPNFPIGAKRIMFDPGYLPSLNRPNVSLHTDPIARVTPDAIVTRDKESGKESEHNTEVIIWATGWGSFSMGVKYPIYGRGGKEIWERWREVGMPRSYQGAMVTEFPNLVLVVGPNTQVWSSFVEVVEMKIDLLTRLIKHMCSANQASFEAREDLEERWGNFCKEGLKSTPYAAPVVSYYKFTWSSPHVSGKTDETSASGEEVFYPAWYPGLPSELRKASDNSAPEEYIWRPKQGRRWDVPVPPTITPYKEDRMAATPVKLREAPQAEARL